MKKILIINANYYKKISTRLTNKAVDVLKKNKINSSVIYVPGVLEIPIVARRNIKKYDAFIALGCVIKGETPHFDLICRSTFDAIIKISIDFNKPITNGIITAFNMDQAIARSSSNLNKGSEAANAVLSFLSNEAKKN